MVPASNSVSALNLERLYSLTGDSDYHKRALEVLKAGAALMVQFPQACAKLLQLIDRLTSRSFEIAIVSDDFPQTILESLRQDFYPNHTFSLKTKAPSTIPLLENRTTEPGKTTFYLCQNQNCSLPLTNLDDVKRELEGRSGRSAVTTVPIDRDGK